MTKAYKSSGFRTVKDCNEPYSYVASGGVASGEAKTKLGSEATKTPGGVSKRFPLHEKYTKGPVSKLKYDGMRHAIKTTEKALHVVIYCFQVAFNLKVIFYVARNP